MQVKGMGYTEMLEKSKYKSLFYKNICAKYCAIYIMLTATAYIAWLSEKKTDHNSNHCSNCDNMMHKESTENYRHQNISFMNAGNIQEQYIRETIICRVNIA